MPIGNWEEMFAESRALDEPQRTAGLRIHPFIEREGDHCHEAERLPDTTRDRLASAHSPQRDPRTPKSRLFNKHKAAPTKSPATGRGRGRCESRPKSWSRRRLWPSKSPRSRKRARSLPEVHARPSSSRRRLQLRLRHDCRSDSSFVICLGLAELPPPRRTHLQIPKRPLPVRHPQRRVVVARARAQARARRAAPSLRPPPRRVA